MLARGNTETETINANIDIQNVIDRWTHKVDGSWLRTVNDDVTFADRWELRGESDYKLTDTTLIYERFLVESGSENTYIQNQLGIEVKISDKFALGLDYAVRHNTDVLPGTEETDQVFTANLVYGF